MLPCFQSLGRLPSSSDLWSRTSCGGVSASAISLSTRGCHLSGPGDLLGFSFINLFLMISSVMVMSCSGGDIMYGLLSGGILMVFPDEDAAEEGIYCIIRSLCACVDLSSL